MSHLSHLSASPGTVLAAAVTKASMRASGATVVVGARVEVVVGGGGSLGVLPDGAGRTEAERQVVAAERLRASGLVAPGDVAAESSHARADRR